MMQTGFKLLLRFPLLCKVIGGFAYEPEASGYQLKSAYCLNLKTATERLLWLVVHRSMDKVDRLSKTVDSHSSSHITSFFSLLSPPQWLFSHFQVFCRKMAQASFSPGSLSAKDL